ncbi:MAG: glycosyltransferase [Lachnospiraceae bacterium]|nr:glycosyltransferase [Lachnospiraceae bacterium]
MKTCKKILYFLDFPLFVGGSNKVLLTQAFIMQQKGYQVKVVIPNDENGVHTEEYGRICENYALESMTANYTVTVCMEEINIMAAIDQHKAIIELLAEEQPDLIHSTQLNIAVELAARTMRIPHLMNIYQVDRQTFNVDWMQVYPQYHCADSVLMSERWKKGLGISSRCVRVAYSSEKNRVIREDRKDSDISILSIGILCERKNQLECLKLIKKCKEDGYNGIKLTVLGEDRNDYGDQCRRYIEENKLQDNVRIMGFVSNVDDYLAAADVLIVASTVESYPGVIVESMANRVPVISTPVAGVPELMRDGENGFLTEGYEVKDLYETFLRYLECKNYGRIPQVIETAYCTYLENHTYESTGNELEKYYQWIVNDYINKNACFLTVAKIRQKLDAFIGEICREGARTKSDKLWLLYHIWSVMKKKDNKEILIWGAGFWGKVAYEWIDSLKDLVQFIGFIDSFKQGNYLGFPIISNKDVLLDKCGMVIVAVAGEKSRLEIMNYLDDKGKTRNRDYFFVYNEPIRL